RLARERAAAERQARQRTAREQAAERKAAQDRAAKDRATRDRGRPVKVSPEEMAKATADEADDSADDDVDDDVDQDLDEADDDVEQVDADDEPAEDVDRDDDGTGETMAAGDEAHATLAVGLGVSTRTLSFNVSPDLIDVPSGYQGGAVPGLAVTGEVYPFALLGKTDLTRRLGVGFRLDRVLRLKTTAAAGAGAARLATSQPAYGFDVRYRHRLGRLTVIGLLGLGGLSFTIDKAAAPAGIEIDVPNVAYRGLEPGILGRYQ